tara:strand:+ start:41 stop:289 length:249 start_codon:yes stop_codon:yes gene_type:complete
MIIGKIAKAVFRLIMPDVVEHLMKVFKMDRLLNYMELENDADRAGKENKVEIEMLKEEVKDTINAVNKLTIQLDKVKKIRSL